MPQEINCPDSFFKASATEKKPKSLKQKIPAFLFDWVFCLPLSNTHLLFSFSIFLNSNTCASSHFHFPFLQHIPFPRASSFSLFQRAPFRPIFLFLYSNTSLFFPFFLSLYSNFPRFSSFFTFLCSNLSHFPTPSPSLYSNASHSTPLFFSYIPTHPSSSRFSFLFTPTPPTSPHFSLPFSPIYPISLHLLLFSIPIRLIPYHFSSPLFSFNIIYSIPFLPSFSFSSKPNHAPKLRKYIFPQNPKPENPFILSKSSHTSAPLKKETLTSSKSKNNRSPQLKISAYSIFSSSLSHSLFSIKQKKDKSFRIYPFLYPLY